MSDTKQGEEKFVVELRAKCMTMLRFLCSGILCKMYEEGEILFVFFLLAKKKKLKKMPQISLNLQRGKNNLDVNFKKVISQH